MANIQPMLHVQIDPTKPVAEICAVISALQPYHKDKEADVLEGVQEAITKRLADLKGDEKRGK